MDIHNRWVCIRNVVGGTDMTEKECYIQLYGELILCVPHYQKISVRPGAVNYMYGLMRPKGEIEAELRSIAFSAGNSCPTRQFKPGLR